MAFARSRDSCEVPDQRTVAIILTYPVTDADILTLGWAADVGGITTARCLTLRRSPHVRGCYVPIRSPRSYPNNASIRRHCQSCRGRSRREGNAQDPAIAPVAPANV